MKIKQISSILFVLLAFFAINGCEKKESSNLKVEESEPISATRSGWGSIWADATGAWAGGSAGVKVGAYAGPNGAVIGGMLGAVGGAAIGSITHHNGGKPAPITDDEWLAFDVLAVPSHEIENRTNEVGALHNLILFDLMNEGHETGDFEHFYSVFERHVLGRNSFGVLEIPNEFKSELARLYDTIVENNEESEYIIELRESMGNLDTDFLINLDNELNEESDLTKLQTLSVLEYTHFFWNKFESL